jgi:hypothetical protein
MRILIRTSKMAIWSRRFGSLAVPLAVLPVFMHREGMITSSDFHLIEIVAMAVALLALVLALGAFGRLWVSGDQGWSKATVGLMFSLLCLVPFSVVLWAAFSYPARTDVTTDFARPPSLVSQVPTSAPGAVERAEIEAAFPNARTRTYLIQAAQMYALAVQLADARDWEPRARREPQTPLAEGQINTVATTLLGWRHEVAVRIAGHAEGAAVDIRSIALHEGPDLGENGRRIEEFLIALDERVTLLLRDAPVNPELADDAEEDL